MKQFFIYIAIITITTLSGCCTQKNGNSSKEEPKEMQMVNDNSFAVKLFDVACKAEKKENFCISPASAMWALSMVANGASGNTLQQIIEALGLEYGNIDNLNNMQSKLIKNLQSDDKETVLSIANSIWINEKLKVKEPFITTNKNHYDALVERAPFNETTLNRINEWCSEHTNGKISSILNRLDDNTKMLLLNALYLKSQWRDSFNPKLTTDAKFTKENGEVVDARMMKQRFRTNYLENDDFQMVSKLLGNGEMEMIFILPDKDKNITQVAEKLAQGYHNYYQQMESNTDVKLSLPKFKNEYATSLKNMLMNIGMSDAFGSKAKFDKISNAPLYIDDVFQKSYIAVDEYGVEAAAVTSVMVGLMSAHRPTTQKEIVLDRPFIYVIAERASESKNILFMGKVGAPEND